MLLNLLASGFFENNQPYFIFGGLIFSFLILIFAILSFTKSSKLSKSLLVNKFKVIDMCEKNTKDDSLLYTIIVTNSSVNAINISSIGFCHDGQYFNYRNEARAQIKDSTDLVIPPRGIIKLRLYTPQLERDIFKNTTVKKLKAVKVYVIGANGESYTGKARVITKKLKEKYKEYYAFHKTEIIDKFVAMCALKSMQNVKLSFSEKIKLAIWKKHASDNLPKVTSPDTEYKNCTLSPSPETTEATPFAIKDCALSDVDTELKEQEKIDSTDENNSESND
ncbi:MAG: hypothetical protein IJF75_01595 [Clostridia bacterium]|nr:hypothetical protein [Clostridia bacterium]